MSPRHVDALRKINLYASGVVICGVDLNYNFECDWLIELSDNELPKTKYPITIWQVNWWKKRVFQTNHSQGNCNFYDCRRKVIAAVKKLHIQGTLNCFVNFSDSACYRTNAVYWSF